MLTGYFQLSNYALKTGFSPHGSKVNHIPLNFICLHTLILILLFLAYGNSSNQSAVMPAKTKTSK